jgi:2-hydroxy-3-keto-5-methylthiopentenyl-1-phosphate phosphatase
MTVRYAIFATYMHAPHRCGTSRNHSHRSPGQEQVTSIPRLLSRCVFKESIDAIDERHDGQTFQGDEHHREIPQSEGASGISSPVVRTLGDTVAQRHSSYVGDGSTGRVCSESDRRYAEVYVITDPKTTPP